MFVFLFVFFTLFHLSLSQVAVDKCSSAVKQASIKDVVSGAVFLDSSHPCGGGFWKLVAHLNMSNDMHQCPSGWREYPNNGSVSVRSCGRPVNSSRECLPTSFETNNFEYSRVCGRITGYQVNTPDAFFRGSQNTETIDSPYVDGISLTHGSSPRKHIWTFAAGSNEYGDMHGCSCGNRSTHAQRAPDLVGENFFCESARDVPGFSHQAGFFANDTLWDGKQCAISSCCDWNKPPWFVVELETATVDDIELRLCMDQSEPDEDVAVNLWEIYVQ